MTGAFGVVFGLATAGLFALTGSGFGTLGLGLRWFSLPSLGASGQSWLSRQSPLGWLWPKAWLPAL